jgi:hypothetical protein
MFLKRILRFGLVSAFAATMTSVPALAGASLTGGMGGPAGYGELSQLPNDDQSSSQLSLPFTINFFGNSYDTFFANNNGNISFGGPLGQYTPSAFPASSLPIIAPYWGDVDTRNQPGGGAVYVGSPNAKTAVVTWNNVGFYPGDNSKTNNFQLLLFDRSDTGAGNFDIEFRYDRLEWTTGGASGGSNGLGGIPAQAGYDAGDFTNYFTLPGSQSNAVLNLQNTSNISTDTPGVWLLTIRNGSITTGETAETPLLPTVATEAGFQFDFNVQLNQRVFIDPLIAIGYDYVVNSGPNIASALFPFVPGDSDGYDVFGFDSLTQRYDLALGHATPGVDFVFGGGGVSRFGLRGIDASSFLDPTNTQAFVTGLTFVDAGPVNMIQTPFTANVGGVPEPASWAMLIAGFGLVGAAARRRRQGARVSA